jgi:hypothetical protein
MAAKLAPTRAGQRLFCIENFERARVVHFLSRKRSSNTRTCGNIGMAKPVIVSCR